MKTSILILVLSFLCLGFFFQALPVQAQTNFVTDSLFVELGPDPSPPGILYCLFEYNKHYILEVCLLFIFIVLLISLVASYFSFYVIKSKFSKLKYLYPNLLIYSLYALTLFITRYEPDFSLNSMFSSYSFTKLFAGLILFVIPYSFVIRKIYKTKWSKAFLISSSSLLFFFILRFLFSIFLSPILDNLRCSPLFY